VSREKFAPSTERLHFFSALLLLSGWSMALNAGDAPPQKPVKSEAELAVNRGREKLNHGEFAEALKEFEAALNKTPGDKDVRLLCAETSYWARKPTRALAYFGQVVDEAPRGSNAEYNAIAYRVLCLNALDQPDAAELAVQRLLEIKVAGRSSQARSARGYVREHLWALNQRGECWEAFDSGPDALFLFRCTVTSDSSPPNTDKILARMAVESSPLPAGGVGYVLSEEKDRMRRVYKRWVFKPEYADARGLFLDILAGKAPVLEEARLPEPAAASAPEPVPIGIQNMGLPPPAEKIVFAAWRLRKVDTPLSKLAELGGEDTAGVTRYLEEFNARYPGAQRDLDELIGAIGRVKPDELRSACDALRKMPERSAYLEFGLLTAFETRAGNLPHALILDFLKSADFVVREAAALLLARAGDMRGLTQLFDELPGADMRKCVIVHGALKELLGPVLLDPPTGLNGNIGEWKKDAQRWRADHLEALRFDSAKDTDGPRWK
jgi:tetratricopeptide (TPR) repeat protein